jgi:hypothetical protein
LISQKYRLGIFASTTTIRKVMFEGSFVETVMGSKVKYIIWRGVVSGGVHRVTSYKEYYLTGKNTHRRLLGVFSILLIKQKMKNVSSAIEKGVSAMQRNGL